MLGQPLNAEEMRVLSYIATGGRGPIRTAQWGRLIMRGLVRVGADGDGAITARGIEVLVERADSLIGCIEGSPEESELEMLSGVLDVLER